METLAAEIADYWGKKDLLLNETTSVFTCDSSIPDDLRIFYSKIGNGQLYIVNCSGSDDQIGIFGDGIALIPTTEFKACYDDFFISESKPICEEKIGNKRKNENVDNPNPKRHKSSHHPIWDQYKVISSYSFAEQPICAEPYGFVVLTLQEISTNDICYEIFYSIRNYLIPFGIGLEYLDELISLLFSKDTKLVLFDKYNYEDFMNPSSNRIKEWFESYNNSLEQNLIKTNIGDIDDEIEQCTYQISYHFQGNYSRNKSARK